MPWFYCDTCGDTIKKPKLIAHFSRCNVSTFTCIDCSSTFDSRSVQFHTSCVTEKQKYVDGATKPGGFAAGGFTTPSTNNQSDQSPEGIKYLSTRPPWRCSLCGVSCTSQKTLLGHAAGSSHKKKVKRAAVVEVASAVKDDSKREEQDSEDITKRKKQKKNEIVKKQKKIDKAEITKKKRKLQRELGLEVLVENGNELSVKKFLKKYKKKAKESELKFTQNILLIMKKLPIIHLTEDTIQIKQ